MGLSAKPARLGSSGRVRSGRKADLTERKQTTKVSQVAPGGVIAWTNVFDIRLLVGVGNGLGAWKADLTPAEWLD